MIFKFMFSHALFIFGHFITMITFICFKDSKVNFIHVIIQLFLPTKLCTTKFAFRKY